MSYEFNTKAEYLAATTMWKADFKAHIIVVRAAKNSVKNANREYSLGTDKKLITKLWDAHIARRKAHAKTIELHEIRIKMKAEAQRQYLKSRE